MSKPAKAAKAPLPIVDPYLPGSGNSGYRVSRYELDLEYKVSSNRLSGTATITAVALAALREVTLDLADTLSVAKVWVNGRPPARFAGSTGKLRITLAATVPPGAARTYSVDSHTDTGFTPPLK
mgnify:CR=1 FL=1